MKKQLENALFCAELAAYAEKDAKKEEGTTSIQNRTFKYKFFSDDGAQAYVFHDNTDVYVVIRGSTEYKDFERAFDVSSKRDKAIKEKIHRGFLKHLDEIYRDMRLYIKDLKGNKNLTLIGHSLGGVMAKIMAIRLNYDLKCITFGEPRGFRGYAKVNDKNKEFIRFVNHLDIVTRIPPFYHFGVREETEYYFDRKGDLKINPKGRSMFFDRLISTKCGLVYLLNKIGTFFMIAEAIDDHLLKNYEKSIRNLLKRL